MIIIAFLLAAVGAGWYYRRTIPAVEPRERRLLAGLRFLTLFIALALLLNPFLNWVRHQVFRPSVIILQDVSASMDEALAGRSKSDRFNEILPALKKQYADLGYDVKIVSFADGLDVTNRQTTQLQRTLGDLAKDHGLERASAAILLSDGWFKDDDFSDLDAVQLPIDAVALNLPSVRYDLELHRVVTNRTAYRGEQTPVAVEAAAVDYTGKASVQLLIDGKAVETRILDFATEPFQQALFEPVFPTLGLHLIEARTIPDNPGFSPDDEPNRDNNRLTSAVQVLADKTGVLVLTDNLNWDTRAIKDALIHDPKRSIQVLRADGPTLYDGRNPVDLTAAVTSLTVVIALFNSGALNLTPAWREQITHFTDNGGGLWIMGRPVVGLESLAPASRSNVQREFTGTIRFTPEADAYDTFRLNDRDVDQIPPVDYDYVNPSAQARILARIDNPQLSPFILYQEYGRGKCLQIAGSGLWRWGQQEGGRWPQMIGDIVSWLGSRSKDRFSALTDKNGYLLGDNVAVRLSAYDERMNPISDLAAEISVQDASGREVFHDFLARDEETYRISIPHLPAGSYRFNVFDKRSGLKTDGSFAISDLAAESRDRGVNLPLLTLVAHATGGKLLSPGEAPSLPEVKPIREDRRVEYPLYRKWWLIALFLIAFCLEIFLRKRRGLA
jgi:hypothetical protein